MYKSFTKSFIIPFQRSNSFERKKNHILSVPFNTLYTVDSICTLIFYCLANVESLLGKSYITNPNWNAYFVASIEASHLILEHNGQTIP